MMQPHFDQKTAKFTDWKPFLDIYRSRGRWKCDIGDEEGGIADLLHFEVIADQTNAMTHGGQTIKKC